MCVRWSNRENERERACVWRMREIETMCVNERERRHDCAICEKERASVGERMFVCVMREIEGEREKVSDHV